MHQRSHQADRKGVTLIEVLLVLTVLAMLAAVTWPALERPMADQRLRKAADKVRTAWTKARVDAMSSGDTFVFRCTLEADEYTIEAQAGPESVSSMTSSNQGQFDDTGVETTEPLSSKTRKLPRDVRFVDGEVDFDTRATILADSADETGGDLTGDCADPILFYPDGTTSTATLTLESKYERRIEVSLRGLTGVVTVGDTYPAEDSIHATR
jgi:prepilin-type N-terminal cleavage/methylation domain-containing protein